MNNIRIVSNLVIDMNKKNTKYGYKNETSHDSHRPIMII